MATYPFPQSPESLRILVTSGRSAERPASFFLSQHWLQCCARTWPEALGGRIIEIPAPDGSVACALIGRRMERRHGFLNSRVLLLNESGDIDLDETFIELNGFYGGQGRCFRTQLDRLVGHLSTQADWDELRLGGVLPAQVESARHVADKHALGVHVLSERPSFKVDLDRIREVNHGDYLASRTSNTRQQIRRSKRGMEKAFGAMRIEAAEGIAQGLEWFDRCGELHRRRWAASRRRQRYGGFDNPSFVRFHGALIEANLVAGRVEMFLEPFLTLARQRLH